MDQILRLNSTGDGGCVSQDGQKYLLNIVLKVPHYYIKLTCVFSTVLLCG